MPISSSSIPCSARAVAIAISEKIGRFVKPDAVQFALRNPRLEQLPNNARNVFASRNLPGQFRHLVIQVAVIPAPHDLPLPNLLQFLPLPHHSAYRIPLPPPGDFHVATN